MHRNLLRRWKLLPAIPVLSVLTLSIAPTAHYGRADDAAAESAVKSDAPLGNVPPRNTSAAVEIHTDVLFAEPDGVPLHCDIYLPRGANNEAPAPSQDVARRSSGVPAVVLVHGGGWAAGDKWTTRGYALSLAEAGLVAVTINYRHAPAHKFPAQLDDVRAALAWVGSHADRYGIDAERVGLFGYSAGGHLACMIGTLADAPWSDVEPTTAWDRDDPRWKSMPSIRAIVGGGAPCEFRDLPVDNTAVAYFLGGSRRELPEVYHAASPTAHASSGDVPTLLIHGTRDAVVPVASSRGLFEAHRAAGVCSEYLPLEGPGHMLTYLHPATKNAAIGFLTSRLNH